MAVTLRIIHEGTEPLDGVTPLAPDTEVTPDPSNSLGTITLPPGTRFGVLDPGSIPYLAGQPSSLILRSFTLASLVGAGGGAHNGAVVDLSGPAIAPGGIQIPSLSRTLAVLGPPGPASGGGNPFTEAGIVPLFPPVPVPPRHILRFNSEADGVAPGPHLIQLTFDVARLCTELWESQPCCPPGTENCPTLTRYQGPPTAVITDPPFNVELFGFYFRPGDTVTFTPQGPGDPLTFASADATSTSRILVTDLDPASTGAPDTYDVTVTRADCPDSTLVGVLQIIP